MTITKSRHGFTLIELIVVIGIIAILATITIIAVNPARQFKLSRDTKRRSDILALLNAVHQYSADNNGSFPAGIPVVAGCATAVSNQPPSGVKDAGANTAGAAYDVPGGATLATTLSTLLANYLTSIPQDPSTGTATVTLYRLCQDASGRLTVWADGTEASSGADYSVTR